MSKRLGLEALHRRLGVQDDSLALCELFKSVSMKTDLHLAVERDPDFFRLYKIQRAERNVWVGEVEKKIEAMGTMLCREAWVNGKKQRVGYAGDLRFSNKVRGGDILGGLFGQAFGESVRNLDYKIALTAIIHSNRAAVSSLVSRSEKFPQKPLYKLFRSFRIRNIQFTMRKKIRKTDLELRTATEADIPVISQFLADDHQQRPFGYVFTEELLRWRLVNWPGLNIEDFYLVHDNEELVGLCAAWDANEVKRFRVLGYNGKMKWIKRAFNFGSLFLGYDPLPPVGELFRYFYLSHLSVRNNDPKIMSALIDRVYADKQGKGYQFFTVYVQEGDNQQPFKPYQYTDLPAGLYLVTEADNPVDPESLGRGRPGFEMALV